MLFSHLFKIPSGSQESIKKIENSLFRSSICSIEKYQLFRSSKMGYLIHDSARELDLVKNLSEIYNVFSDPDLKKYRTRSVTDLNTDRDLNLIKIYNLIIEQYEIKSSAPKLQKILKHKEIDLFLNALTHNSYQMSFLSKNGTRFGLISLKDGFNEP